MRMEREPFPCQRWRRRGMALVIVLGLLVLLVALVVGFLMQVGGARQAAANYSATAEARLIADSTINLVQAQINEATTPASGSVWASQPGAIRVFGPNGNLDQIYRLYSASSLRASSSAALSSDVPGPDWRDFPAQWVDINAPAYSPSGGQNGLRFPILDPRDPTGSGILSLEGFALNSPPAATSTQPAPMSVRWLYVLQNGEMIAPDPGSGNPVATFNMAAVQPSKDNPIIGRTAFWTDDESCKININTAGDGTYWTTPRFEAPDERKRAKFQPAALEYQRYPGHPATTTLRPLFEALGMPSSAMTASMGTQSQLFKYFPRYNDDYGSKGGMEVPTQTPTATTERLYSAIGEMLFDANRGATSLNHDQVESAKFFVTAHSRAPELNLYGQPRIAIWPISEANDIAHRSAVDQLLAFCSTYGGHAYHFTRTNPHSSTADISLTRNRELMNYLDRLTSEPVPGVGKSFDGKYGTQETRQILTEIFDYIRITNLQDATVSQPYAVASTGNYGAGQVVPSQHGGWGTQGFGRFYRITEFSLIMIAVGKGQDLPVDPDSDADDPVPVGEDQANAAGGYTGSGSSRTPATGKTAVQAFLVMNFFDPALGWSAISPDFQVQIAGLDSVKVNGIPIGMMKDGKTYVQSEKPLIHARAYGGPMDWRESVRAKQFGTTMDKNTYPFYSQIFEVNTGDPMTVSSDEITVTQRSGSGEVISTFRLKFDSVTVPAPGIGNLIKPPTVAATMVRPFGTKTNIADATGNIDRFHADVIQKAGFINKMLDPSADVVVSLVLAETVGDYRLLARNSIDDTYFVNHPALATGTVRQAYSFDAPYAEFPNYQRGTLLAPTVSVKRNPYVPATVMGAKGGGNAGVPPDWDNAIGGSGTAVLDGPYINKPDEGNQNNIATAYPYFDDDYIELALDATLFSPNRQVASPVCFGSLPTGVISRKPWQTLLFRPSPLGHKGAGAPADHYLLDLFWMPVVEPYAISEPFSTAGKVNLNYQIVPFDYIQRSTALRAVLESERVAKVGNLSKSYVRNTEGSSPNSPLTGTPARFPLNMDENDGTLRPFKEKFGQGEIFKSATEICDIYLVPEGEEWSSDGMAQSKWYGRDFEFVGDNTREQPYGDIYPRVTTKSNVFRIYYTSQALKNVSKDPAVWNEDQGTVSGEVRGSTIIERYLDRINPNLPDPAADSSAGSLDPYYRWRIISNQLFGS